MSKYPIIQHCEDYYSSYHQGAIIHCGRLRSDSGREKGEDQDNDHISAAKYIDSCSERLWHPESTPG